MTARRRVKPLARFQEKKRSSNSAGWEYRILRTSRIFYKQHSASGMKRILKWIEPVTRPTSLSIRANVWLFLPATGFLPGFLQSVPRVTQHLAFRLVRAVGIPGFQIGSNSRRVLLNRSRGSFRSVLGGHWE